MRHRAEILLDATKKTDKGFTIPESDNKLTLLTLEVLVDIRDELHLLTEFLSTFEKIPRHVR